MPSPSPKLFGTALFRHTSASRFSLLVNRNPTDAIAVRTMVVFASVKNVAEAAVVLLKSHEKYKTRIIINPITGAMDEISSPLIYWAPVRTGRLRGKSKKTKDKRRES
jgi:hypothetical protein